jgi:hypothetical protein
MRVGGIAKTRWLLTSDNNKCRMRQPIDAPMGRQIQKKDYTTIRTVLGAMIGDIAR